MKCNLFDKHDISEQIEFIEAILENEPPYKEILFNTKWYVHFNNIKTLSINSFCENCDNDRIFTGDVSCEMHNTFSNDVFRSVGRNPNVTDTQPQEKYFDNKIFFLNIKLRCAKCGEQHYYSLLFCGNKVRKIGQYPSYVSCDIKELKKYKNIIPKYYVELTKSVSAYSQRMGVAAFVYLRRILENLVDNRIKNPDGMKFIDKLKEVEKTEQIIPNDLQEIKGQIYNVLSKGVHEYDDEECLQLYLAVRYVITSVLDIELKKKEDKKNAMAAIKAIKSKLSGGK